MTIEQTGRFYLEGLPTHELRREQEALVEDIQGRFGPLSAQRRAMLEIILQYGGTFGQVACLQGEHASTVSRRFRRLLGKLSAPASTPPESLLRLNPMEKSILAEYFLCGQSQLDIAVKLAVSRYRVRQTLRRVREYAAAQAARQEAAS